MAILPTTLKIVPGRAHKGKFSVARIDDLLKLELHNVVSKDLI